MLCTVPRNSGWNYFPTFGNEGFEKLDIVKVDEPRFLCAKPANFVCQKRFFSSIGTFSFGMSHLSLLIEWFID